jgi:hypothetical protein
MEKQIAIPTKLKLGNPLHAMGRIIASIMCGQSIGSLDAIFQDNLHGGDFEPSTLRIPVNPDTQSGGFRTLPRGIGDRGAIDACLSVVPNSPPSTSS